jgi:hypothetical protein
MAVAWQYFAEEYCREVCQRMHALGGRLYGSMRQVQVQVQSTKPLPRFESSDRDCPRLRCLARVRPPSVLRTLGRLRPYGVSKAYACSQRRAPLGQRRVTYCFQIVERPRFSGGALDW